MTKHCAILLSLFLFCGPVFGAGEPLVFSSGKHRNVLVELFSSQGCSSCPPAERWMSRFVNDKKLWSEVVPVAFHVDYWDYIGWKDPFDSSIFSARQRKYYDSGAVSSLYTPCFVVNGAEWKEWYAGGDFPGSAADAGLLSVRIEKGYLNAEYPSGKGKLYMHIALLGFGLVTDVKSGENSGKKLAEDFVVLDYGVYSSDTQRWRVKFPAKTTAPAKRLAVAVWLSGDESEGVIQSAGSWM
jgi:hypothetical protein